jgi:hypothetical protein
MEDLERMAVKQKAISELHVTDDLDFLHRALRVIAGNLATRSIAAGEHNNVEFNAMMAVDQAADLVNKIMKERSKHDSRTTTEGGGDDSAGGAAVPSETERG